MKFGQILAGGLMIFAILRLFDAASSSEHRMRNVYMGVVALILGLVTLFASAYLGV
jgi:hypothetical protein